MVFDPVGRGGKIDPSTKGGADFGPLLGEMEGDTEALGLLTNTDGVAFKDWVANTAEVRRDYSEQLKKGYPADPIKATNASPEWESWLAFADEQFAIATAFKERAIAVMQVVLMKRGMKQSPAESLARGRAWKQIEEMVRWDALARTLKEWCYAARGTEKRLNGPGGPGSGRQ